METGGSMSKKIDSLMRSNSNFECLLDCVRCGGAAIALIDAENSNVHIKVKGKKSYEIGDYSEDINSYTKFDSRFITHFNKVLVIECHTPVCLACLALSFDPLIEKGKKEARKKNVDDAIINTGYYTKKIYEILENHFPLPDPDEEYEIDRSTR